MIKKRTSLSGFTLVELLVVVAIIAVLVAVGTAGYGAALRAAQTSQCTSNLRQIGAGFQGYLGDHNYMMPQRIYMDNTPYFVVLNPYAGGSDTTKVGSVFVCPTQTSNDFPTEPSYGMNWYYDNMNVASMANATTTIMVTETTGSDGTGSNRADRNSGDPGELDPKRHGGKANYLFFDGHIEKLYFSDTTAGGPGADMWGTDGGSHTTQSPPN